MTTNVGMINSSILNGTQDYVEKSFAAQILRLMPNGTAPLFALTSMLKEETALSFEHGYFTKSMVFPEMVLNGNIDNSQGIITVDSTANVIPGATFLVLDANSNFEQIIVNNVLSDTQVSVQRGVGTTAYAARDNTVLVQIGNAQEEGSTRPQALQIAPVRITNLTQIFRNSWSLTRTAEALAVIAGDAPAAENKMDCATQHSTAIEQSLIFGKKYSGTRNGQPFRRMDGFVSIVSNAAYYPAYAPTPNVHTAGATTNWTQFEAMLESTLNQATDPKGGTSRLIVAGKTAYSVINNIGRLNNAYTLGSERSSFGQRFTNFVSARGSFDMIEHPLLNTNSVFAKMALVVDMSTFGVAYLTGGKTFHTGYNAKGEQVESGIDATGGTLTTELTCLIKNPPANAVIYNLTAAAAG